MGGPMLNQLGQMLPDDSTPPPLGSLGAAPSPMLSQLGDLQAPVAGNIMYANGPAAEGAPPAAAAPPPPAPATPMLDALNAAPIQNPTPALQQFAASQNDRDTTQGSHFHNIDSTYGPGISKLAARSVKHDGSQLGESERGEQEDAATMARNAPPGQSFPGVAGSGLTASYVKGHHDASYNPWTKEHQNAYFEADEREKNAQEQVANIDASDQLRKAAQTEDLASQLKIQDDAAKLAEAKRQKDVADNTQKLSAAVEDVRNTKINPMQAFQEMGAGAKFLSIIGAAVSGFVSPGGRNQMLDTLDNIAQKNIDAQKANLETKKEGVAGQRGLLAEMRQRFGDDRQAEIAAKIAIREQASMKAEQMAAASGSERAIAGAAAMRAAADKRNALDARQLVDIPSFVPAHYSGGTPTTPAEEARIVTLENGTRIKAPTAGEAEKLRMHQAAIVDLERDTKQLNKLRNDADAYIPYTPKHAELQKLAGQVTLNIRKVEEIKSPGKGTADIADQIVGDPTSITSRSGQRGLSYAADERKNFEASVRSMGAEKVGHGYTRNPKTGEVETTAPLLGDRVTPAAQMPASFRADK